MQVIEEAAVGCCCRPEEEGARACLVQSMEDVVGVDRIIGGGKIVRAGEVPRVDLGEGVGGEEFIHLLFQLGSHQQAAGLAGLLSTTARRPVVDEKM